MKWQRRLKACDNRSCVQVEILKDDKHEKHLRISKKMRDELMKKEEIKGKFVKRKNSKLGQINVQKLEKRQSVDKDEN